MNQSLLLNDDLKYNVNKQCWLVTVFYNGLKINCHISNKILNKNTNINEETLFDLETIIENWLIENELENDNLYIE